MLKMIPFSVGAVFKADIIRAFSPKVMHCLVRWPHKTWGGGISLPPSFVLDRNFSLKTMLCPFYDLVLQVFGQIHEIGTVAGYPDQKVLVFLWVLLSSF